jgi:drug/metabolite transporter (DMT)-like permease
VRRLPRLTPIDGLLLLMVFIWGANFSVVKAALRDIPPLAFNTIRLVLSSVAFLAAIAVTGIPKFTKRDALALLGLAFIGHFIYQLCFLGGLARTTASNSSLILGCSPVAVTLASAMAGHERVPRGQWAGVLLSVAGIYLVVGTGAHFGGDLLTGDLLTLGAVVCWSVYTVGARPLLTRHSPLVVTGVTMTAGSMLLAPLGIPELRALDWSQVRPWTWVAVGFSSIFALNVAYLIWYTAVQRIGNLRTSVYSNVTPIVGMSVAALFLGESVTTAKVVGAAAILCGVAVTRVASRSSREQINQPAEE